MFYYTVIIYDRRLTRSDAPTHSLTRRSLHFFFFTRHAFPLCSPLASRTSTSTGWRTAGGSGRPPDPAGVGRRRAGGDRAREEARGCGPVRWCGALSSPSPSPADDSLSSSLATRLSLASSTSPRSVARPPGCAQAELRQPRTTPRRLAHHASCSRVPRTPACMNDLVTYIKEIKTNLWYLPATGSHVGEGEEQAYAYLSA
jgi:hypothetical protein